MNVYESLANVQQSLKATKDQFNKFGGYNYRSCESILESVKPLLAKEHLALTLTDEMVQVGERIYVKATATVFPTDCNGGVTITGDKIESKTGQFISVDAYAREEESKKGMDSSQVTGAASSYARKYALNGLFCIDDNKDSDATNTHGKDESPPKQDKPKAAPKAENPKPEPKQEPPKETPVDQKKYLQDMLADKVKSLVKTEGGVEFAICENCGGYIYKVAGKEGTIEVPKFCEMGLKRFGKAVCKNCFAELNEKKNAK